MSSTQEYLNNIDAGLDRLETNVNTLEALQKQHSVLLNKVINRVEALELRNAKLRAALAAYRSALRSGEPETEQLKRMADEAL